MSDSIAKKQEKYNIPFSKVVELREYGLSFYKISFYFTRLLPLQGAVTDYGVFSFSPSRHPNGRCTSGSRWWPSG